MNGAQSLIRTLVNNGVEVCFTNPGTSEMHFVAALDDVPEMKGILCLFEGVATGAADGYGRMAGRAGSTLLHLGPGLGNGSANLHNARRATSPVLNIVGDHATYHKQYDAPLESDIDAVAGAFSDAVVRTELPEDVCTDAVAGIAATQVGGGSVCTLVLPADVCWLDGPEPLGAAAVPQPVAPTDAVLASLRDAAAAGSDAVLLIGGRMTTERGLVAATRVADKTGMRLFCETFPTRQERGAGLPPVERIAYLAEFAQMQIGEATHLVAVDTPAPVSFFAYPDKASVLTPEGCQILSIGEECDPVLALEAFADELGAATEVARAEPSRPESPTGPLTSETVAAAIGALLPEHAIVVDEANTSGLFAPGATAGCPRHDWLTLTGGAIGSGIPLAVGAATACPDRPVLCLEADGSAMYTLQGLWTQVRENQNVTTIIYSNRSYAVLNMELNRVGATEVGPRAKDMLDLTRPELDFVHLAQGMGVSATKATTSEEFMDQLAHALSEDGPHLIEAVVPPLGL